MKLRAGDRIEWDNDAHTHTKQMDIMNTGKIESILPKNFKHVSHVLDECELDRAAVIWVKVDDSPARIGLGPRNPDLRFPDAKKDDGMDLMDELWDDETTQLMTDLLG